MISFLSPVTLEPPCYNEVAVYFDKSIIRFSMVNSSVITCTEVFSGKLFSGNLRTSYNCDTLQIMYDGCNKYILLFSYIIINI